VGGLSAYPLLAKTRFWGRVLEPLEHAGGDPGLYHFWRHGTEKSRKNACHSYKEIRRDS
jgi:hypothetical protein